jgi:hypothetical protein
MKKCLTALMFCLAMFIATAQKLPNVQESPLFAPVDIKVNGKAAEWGPQLQAYNKATDVSYTIANDTKNFYLLVQANKPRTIEKIVSVGLTLIINPNGKKNVNDEGNVLITYPIIDHRAGQRMLWYAGAKAKPAYSSPVIADTTKYSEVHADSLIAIANSLFVVNAKSIKVKGIKDITDPAISIYNEEGIKAVATFNNNGVYTYELAIPLKYLGLSVSEFKKFTYNVRLESRLTEPKSGLVTRFIYPNGQALDIDQDLDSTTDFWGEYTLAKK